MRIRCTIKNNIETIGKMVLGTMLSVCMLASCNEPFENVLKEEYVEPNTKYQQGKVLLIMVEGAAGRAFQQAINAGQAPRIRRFLDHSTYTFEGLADARSNLSQISNERGWANLLTGVTTHEVGDTRENLSEMEVPSFLSLLKSTAQKPRSALFSTNADIVATLENDVDSGQLLSDDATATQAAIARIEDHGEATPDILMVHLGGVQKSGIADGFYSEDGVIEPHIIAAIADVDKQVGEMVDALTDRPDFAIENWLVIVTSNYGGVYTGEKEGTHYDDPERNTFTMLYSPRLTSKLLQPVASEIRYNYYSPWFSGSGGTDMAVVRDASLFNMGSRATDTKSYTIQFMIYDTWPNAGQGHTILSKRPRVNNGAGWNIRMNSSGGNVAVVFEGNSGWGGENWYQIRKVNPWRVYTYVYKECGNVDSLINYLDGVEYRRVAINNNEMSNDAPLTIGKIEGSNIGNQGHFFVNNLQIYDVALTPEYLAQNYCKTGLDKIDGFEYWDNLIGYWPNDREENYGGRILPDYSKYGSIYGGENAGRSDMVLTNAAWETGSMLDPNVCPNPDAAFFREVFNTVDIPFQIMSWLGVSVDRQWQLEGVGWPLEYGVMTN